MVHIMIWGEDEFFLTKDYTEVIDRYKKKKIIQMGVQQLDNASLIYPALRDKPVAGCIYGKGKGWEI